MARSPPGCPPTAITPAVTLLKSEAITGLISVADGTGPRQQTWQASRPTWPTASSTREVSSPIRPQVACPIASAIGDSWRYGQLSTSRTPSPPRKPLLQIQRAYVTGPPGRTA